VNNIFNMFFDAMMAYNQIGYMLAGLVCLAIGGGLTGWFIYGHLTGKRVKGRVASVRADGYVATPGSGKKYPYNGEMYYAVYEYNGPDGTLLHSQDGSGSNNLGGKIPGAPVWLYLNPRDPYKIMRSGLLGLLFGLFFAVPGVLFLDVALTHFKFNIFTIVIPVFLVAHVFFRFQEKLKPHELRDKIMQIRTDIKTYKSAPGYSPQPPVKGARELTMDEIRERLRVQSKINRQIAPVAALIGTGLIVLGFYSGHGLANMLSTGVRTQGTIIRLESVYSSSGSGSHYTYYPVVTFDVPGAGRREFKDRVGGNPPVNQVGDNVTVLYDPARPDKALIDRGLWNWLIPGSCLMGGLLLLCLTFKAAR
jgi:hypothetical protein